MRARGEFGGLLFRPFHLLVTDCTTINYTRFDSKRAGKSVEPARHFGRALKAKPSLDLIHASATSRRFFHKFASGFPMVFLVLSVMAVVAASSSSILFGNRNAMRCQCKCRCMNNKFYAELLSTGRRRPPIRTHLHLTALASLLFFQTSPPSFFFCYFYCNIYVR